MFLSISAEGRIVMLVKRKSSHHNDWRWSRFCRSASIIRRISPIDTNESRKTLYVLYQTLFLFGSISLSKSLVSRNLVNLGSRRKRSIMSGTGHLPRVTPTLPTVAGSSGVRT
jgi:hypothetical protein